MNVALWLRGLGLEQYAEAFAAHDVDGATLPQLTERDLVEIGVVSVGHRRRLLTALAQLQPPAAEAAPQQLQQPQQPPPVAGGEQAEYRQLSVLYCEMAVSAAAGDEEGLRARVQAFHRTCAGAVAAFDGHLANFYGDRVLAYFGWPRAHEDDAERAVRAALRMLREGRQQGMPLRASVGTGDVVVGDLIHDGPAAQQSAVGLTPNLAARLLGLAADHEVVIDPLTRQLLPASFSCRALGEHVLKGVAASVSAYAVDAERQVDSRFDARSGRDLTPLLGREQELALLRERWDQACLGEGAAVLMVGEAGIGKSRLVRALLDACGSAPPYVHLQCSPYHTGSALWPVIQHLTRSARLQAGDSADRALDKLEGAVGEGDVSAVYATLLGLNGAQRYGDLQMSPQMLRERTLEVLTEQLFDFAGQQPLMLIVEDLHWVDPTTAELLERCLERIDAAPVLMLLTSRAEPTLRLAGHPCMTRLSLNRLSRASAGAMAERLAGGRLKPQTLGRIVAQADGVPLFVEELTKAVLETGETAIPASLQGSLVARLDRVPEVKGVAQVAACIGREFDLALLQAVCDRPETVAPALDKLIGADLVFRRGDRANPRFTFKHALVQEAAAESLLGSTRRHIHARVFQALQQRPDTAPEVLAHHAERAGLVAKAVGLWQQAGEAAQGKSAYAEAAAHLRRAIGLLGSLPDGVQRRGLDLRLHLRLGQACALSQGYGAEAVRMAFDKAHVLLDEDCDSLLRAQVVRGAWTARLNRREFGAALALANDYLASLPEGGEPAWGVLAHRMVGAASLYTGDMRTARLHLAHALSQYDAQGSTATAWHALSERAAMAIQLAWALIALGRVRYGRRVLQAELAAAQSLGDVTLRSNALYLGGMAATCLGDAALMAKVANALSDVSAIYRLPMHAGYATLYRAATAAVLARHEEAAAAYERGLQQIAATHSSNNLPFFQARLALSLAACGRTGPAHEMLERAFADTAATGPAWWEPDLWRMRGELLQMDGPAGTQAAAQAFEQSLALARARGSRWWARQAQASLDRLRPSRSVSAFRVA